MDPSDKLRIEAAAFAEQMIANLRQKMEGKPKKKPKGQQKLFK